MAWRIGVDIGGTFTDVALVDERTGRIGVAKVQTTPADFGQGVLDGLKLVMAKYQIEADNVGLLAHATTIVTNAILEEKGAPAALIMSRGFRDILELRRSARPDLYDLFQDGPRILIPRRNRMEITERIGADGSIVTPLAETEIEGLIEAIRSSDVKAIAVSLMFSFLNPAHEKALGSVSTNSIPRYASLFVVGSAT